MVFKLDPGTCHDCLGKMLATLAPEDVRIAKPVPTRHGSWRHEGWIASQWVEGAAPKYAATTVWLDIIEAGRAFHRAVAHLSRPHCLDERQDPWAAADRAAWGEEPCNRTAPSQQWHRGCRTHLNHWVTPSLCTET